MTFISATFIVFLFVTLGVYWSLPSLRVRRVVLVVASLVFYAWWDVRLTALVFSVTTIAYASARGIVRFPAHRRLILTVAVALQLGQLCFFKYANFLLSIVSDVASLAGLPWEKTHFNIILPIGISFYTFHGISYVVDIYRGKLVKPVGPLVTALYIVFFPQLVAGPIVRADVFIPQALRSLRLELRDVVVGLKLVIIGLLYKAVFADRLAAFVDPVFTSPASHGGSTLAAGVFGFYSQIYFDFAGYSLMAIGFSRLFGFRLPKNFDFPYRSTSITEFWRRWHISLSTWLRDYLYIPLGGNRFGTFMQYRNLMLTMFLGGLWHGASYNFVLWGTLHGLALAFHKAFATWWPPTGGRLVSGSRIVLGWVLTQGFVLLAWIPFRAKSLSDTGIILATLFGQRSGHTPDAALPFTLLFVPIVVDTLLVQRPALAWFPAPRRPLLVLALLGLFLAITLPLVSMTLRNFIYFQF